jgi:hypothetical protein
MNIAEEGNLTAHASLSLQLRSGGTKGGFMYVTAVYARLGRSIDNDSWESTAGLEFGGDPFFSLVDLFMQWSGW